MRPHNVVTAVGSPVLMLNDTPFSGQGTKMRNTGRDVRSGRKEPGHIFHVLTSATTSK